MQAGEGDGRLAARAPELDLLRVVAAALVLLYHYTWAASEMGLGGPAYPVVVTAWSRYGYLGIELFFLLSGLVITHSVGQRRASRFAVSRAIRLYPAYWAAVTLTAVVLVVWGGPLGDAVTPARYLLNLTMLTGFVHGTYVDAVYWTLTAELSFYAVVWFALAIGRRRDLVAVLAGWLLVSTANERLVHQDEVAVLLATRSAPYFVTGACLALLTGPSADRRASWRRTLAWGTGALAAVLAVRATVVRVDAANQALFRSGGLQPAVAAAFVVAAVAVLALVATGRLRRVGRPWMTTAALVTYPLYLLHSNVGLVLFRRWDGVNRWVLLVAVTTVVVALAWAVHLLVERPLAVRLTRAAARVGRGAPPVAGDSSSTR